MRNNILKYNLYKILIIVNYSKKKIFIFGIKY